MGMEYMRPSSVKYYPALTYKSHYHLRPDSFDNVQQDDSFLSHSAPTSSTFFTSTTSCRRAASFPIANAAFLSSGIKARSQSESGALNALNVKVPRNILQEIKLYGSTGKKKTYSQEKIGGVTFFAPIEDGIQSDSEGEEHVSSPDDSFDDEEEETESYHTAPDQPEMLDCMPLGDFDFFDSLELEPEKPNLNAPLLIVAEQNVEGKEEEENEALSPIFESSSETEKAEIPKSDEPPPEPEQTRTPNKNKCRVRFADECNFTLTTIRVMTEPSDYPPQIPVDVLRRHRKAAGMEDLDETPKPKSTWKVLFKQPASEYVKFRQRLESVHVALENAMIKNDFPKMLGTIKVANLSFEKRVFLRGTSDKWTTHKDYPAKFQVSASKLFDTFTFDVPLPCNVGAKESNFEFCICYQADNGIEYWDSNEGLNYKLTGEEYPNTALLSPPSPLSKVQTEPKPIPLGKQRYMCDDAYRMDYENWSKFASWKALSTDMPYW